MEYLRTWLSHLHRPDRLDTPEIRRLLAAHRRLPATLSPATVAAAALRLLTEKIAALKRPDEAAGSDRLPYRVLETCFVRRKKLFQAAAELGLSERQLSRERTRALALLAGELATFDPDLVPPLEIPPGDGLIRRDALLRELTAAAATHRLVAVTGAPGTGKTTAVSMLAHALGSEVVSWHRLRAGVNDSLEALLFELGQRLAVDGDFSLRDYFLGALPDVRVATATRLALDALAGKTRLVVLDDYSVSAARDSIDGFLEEAIERLTLLTVVAIGGVVDGAKIVAVPALTRAESAELLRFGGLSLSGHVIKELHAVSRGNPRMLAAVAAWCRGEARGLRALERHLKRRGALANLAELVRFSQREAA